MLVTRSDTNEYVTAGAGGVVSCTAAIGKRRLQPRVRGFIPRGDAEAAACSFRAPKNAVHKMVRGALSVSLGGISATRSFTVKIR